LAFSTPLTLSEHVVVIGAGPAGLTAAYELTKYQRLVTVVEKHDGVGGLARTVNYKGYHFDLDGHRFFTKAPEVQKLWMELLGVDFLARPRLSRIYYDGKFFHYPLRALSTFAGLGLLESMRIAASYLWRQLFPYRQVDTFEQWVTNRFGRRLFKIFFERYTEKVWGIPCSQLKAEWAAQRIQGLSARTALLGMLRSSGTAIRTLIDEFYYPRQGPGMMWDAARDEVVRRGGVVRVASEVVAVRRAGHRIEGVVVRGDGDEETITGTHFISSMPLRELIERLEPPAPEAVRAAAARLTYRAFVTVCLVVHRAELFPDNWIYVHDPGVRVGRIQNFKNWSQDMVPDPRTTSLGLEYFCNDGDDLWRLSDAELVALATREVEAIGLARASEVRDGCVQRVPKAYPVYDSTYREYLDIVRCYVESLENLQTIGRSGLHRYNNQDHAMLTGMAAVRNLVHRRREDIWSINTDGMYHEEAVEGLCPPESGSGPTSGRADGPAPGLLLGVGVAVFLCSAMLMAAGQDKAVPGAPARPSPAAAVWSPSAPGS
jgi:protoporphyrinogen oxidase